MIRGAYVHLKGRHSDFRSEPKICRDLTEPFQEILLAMNKEVRVWSIVQDDSLGRNRRGLGRGWHRRRGTRRGSMRRDRGAIIGARTVISSNRPSRSRGGSRR
jgi:hypothetical protein